MTTELICDFCSAHAPTWRYPARTFDALDTPDLRCTSLTDWSACDACHALIDADDRDGLTRRVLDAMIRKHPETALAQGPMRAFLRGMHAQFFAARQGPAVAIVAVNGTSTIQ